MQKNASGGKMNEKVRASLLFVKLRGGCVMRFSGWRMATIIQALMFIIIAGWILVRPKDGTGAVQTPESRAISVGIWIGFAALVAILELIGWGISKLSKRHRSN